MVSLPETDVEEDHRDVGQMTSNNGQEYSPADRLCSMYKREERMEILGVCVSDLQSSDIRKDQGKARGHGRQVQLHVV